MHFLNKHKLLFYQFNYDNYITLFDIIGLLKDFMNEISIKKLNKTCLTELALLMSWRSNPLIYNWFLLQNEPLKWENHNHFVLAGIHRLDYLVYLNGRPIGHVAVSKTDCKYPEISIMIGEITLWGKGFSSIILKKFLELLISEGFSNFSAKISDSNLNSINLFKKSGFIYLGEVPDVENWSVYLYHKNLNI